MILAIDETPTNWLGVVSLAITAVLAPAIGAISRWIYINQRDIKVKLEKCEHKHDHYKAIIRHLLAEFQTIAVIRINNKGLITEWSPECIAMFKWDSAEMLGQSLDRILPYSTRSACANGIKKAVESNLIIHDKILETEALTKTNGAINVRVKINTWIDKGEWTGVAEIRRLKVNWTQFDNDRPQSVHPDSDDFT